MTAKEKETAIINKMMITFAEMRLKTVSNEDVLDAMAQYAVEGPREAFCRVWRDHKSNGTTQSYCKR